MPGYTPTSLNRLYDDYEGQLTGGEKSWTRAFTGRTLDEELALIKAGTLASWVPTMEEDFADVATAVVPNADVTVTPATGRGPWMTPGINGFSQGIWQFVSIDHVDYPNMFSQLAPNGLGMAARKPTGLAASSTNMTTVRHATTTDVKSEAIVTFAQQYGYFEWNFRAPSPLSPATFNGVLWPALFMYSLNQWGGTYGNISTPRCEWDILEIYQDSRGGEKATAHCSLHHHESKRLNARGFWNRDISDVSNLISMTNAAETARFSTDIDTRFYNGDHAFGGLMTPEWLVCYYNRIEMGRFKMNSDLQQKWVLFTTLGVQTAQVPAGQTTPSDLDFIMRINSINCWQNPDWHRSDLSPVTNEPVTDGGTANARTFTTTLPMASYAAGQDMIFVAKASLTNTGAMTFNVNGHGTRPVVKLTADPNTVPPAPYVFWSTYEALTANNVLIGEYYAYKIDEANSRIIALDRCNSVKHPVYTEEDAFGGSLIDVDMLAEEAKFAHLARLGDLFPADLPRPSPDLSPTVVYEHPARVDPFVGYTTLKPAYMPPDVYFTVVEGRAVDAIVGRVEQDNAATRTRMQMVTNTYFDINVGNGDVFVKVAPVIGEYEIIVTGWPATPAPTPSNVNRTRVHISVVADVLFDPTFFGANRLMDFDATVLASLTLAGSKVSQWTGLGNISYIATQGTDANRPTYNATGLNGHPCLISTGTPIIMSLNDRVGLTGSTINIEIRLSESAFFNNTALALSDAYDYTVPHILYWEWDPLNGARCYVNGLDIGIVAPTGPTFINNGWAMAVLSSSIPPGGRGIILAQNETAAWLFMSGTNSATGFAGKLSRLVIGKGSQTTEGRDKLHGMAGHQFFASGGVATILPAGHPYRDAPPHMIG